MTTPPNYEIFAIRYAKQDLRAEGHLFLGGDHNKMLPGLDFFTYVIRGGGRTWVIDTGFTPEGAAKMGRKYDYLIRPCDALAKLGIDAATATDVILTHAHFDHVGTLDDDPNAKFHIQDQEMIHVTGRDMSHPRFRAAYNPDDVKNLIDLIYADRMIFHDGDVTLAPGLEFILIGGHARGQAILRVHTERGWVILASDAVHLFEETDEERPFVIFYDLFGMIEGYRRINAMAGHRDLIVPGHDARVTRAYPAAGPGMEGLILKLHVPPTWG